MFAPYNWERVHCPPPGYIGMFERSVAFGVRFPFPRILTEYLRDWGVGFSQVSPIAWLKIISLLVLFSQQGWEMPTPDDIRALFLMKETRKKSGQFSISVRDPRFRDLITKVPETINKFKSSWFWPHRKITRPAAGAPPELGPVIKSRPQLFVRASRARPRASCPVRISPSFPACRSASSRWRIATPASVCHCRALLTPPLVASVRPAAPQLRFQRPQPWFTRRRATLVQV
ncbi:Unknown protein [Striga hermonthica]|uniref:Uncharacterized protein n=1 Tax=Striga hermonthica TaxID=68872 RepID=A0A9N7R4Q4_STRHE|nr:Unknown protein [Striga hermonthica]